MMHFLGTFSIMRAKGVRVIQVVQNYGKIIYIKNIFKNGWKEDAHPSSYPSGSAPGRKLVLDKNHQKSLAHFSHLAPLILFFFTKKQMQKGGIAQCPPPYAPAFDHTFYTGADRESFGGRGV